jgi:hypothetical protein
MRRSRVLDIDIVVLGHDDGVCWRGDGNVRRRGRGSAYRRVRGSHSLWLRVPAAEDACLGADGDDSKCNDGGEGQREGQR